MSKRPYDSEAKLKQSFEELSNAPDAFAGYRLNNMPDAFQGQMGSLTNAPDWGQGNTFDYTARLPNAPSANTRDYRESLANSPDIMQGYVAKLPNPPGQVQDFTPKKVAQAPQAGGYSSQTPDAPQAGGYSSQTPDAPQAGGYSSQTPNAPQVEGYQGGPVPQAPMIAPPHLLGADGSASAHEYEHGYPTETTPPHPYEGLQRYQIQTASQSTHDTHWY